MIKTIQNTVNVGLIYKVDGVIIQKKTMWDRKGKGRGIEEEKQWREHCLLWWGNHSKRIKVKEKGKDEKTDQ